MAIKYKWIAEKITTELPLYEKKGGKLPSEDALAKKYHVSRQTIRDALSRLVEEGYLEKRKGSGTYLTGLMPEEKKNRIALLLPSLQEYIYPRLVADLTTRFDSVGFSLTCYETQNDPGIERELLQKLLEDAPRAILLEGCRTALPCPNLDLLEALEKKNIHLVFLHNYYIEMKHPLSVKDDNRQGSRMLVEHLFAKGHKTIAGLFMGDDLQGLERYQGFLERYKEAGLPLPTGHVGWYHTNDLMMLRENKDFGLLQYFLEEILSQCSAVICYNDELAYHLIPFLIKHGYRVPEDIAVASFDNTFFEFRNLPSLTSLYHKPHEISQTAFQITMQKIKGFPAVSREIPWELFVQESTSSTLY